MNFVCYIAGLAITFCRLSFSSNTIDCSCGRWNYGLLTAGSRYVMSNWYILQHAPHTEMYLQSRYILISSYSSSILLSASCLVCCLCNIVVALFEPFVNILKEVLDWPRMITELNIKWDWYLTNKSMLKGTTYAFFNLFTFLFNIYSCTLSSVNKEAISNYLGLINKFLEAMLCAFAFFHALCILGS